MVRTKNSNANVLPLAGDKTTVVSTVVGAAEEVFQLIGPCAEMGAWCKKLGVDYALAAEEFPGGPRRVAHRTGRQVVGVRAEAKRESSRVIGTAGS